MNALFGKTIENERNYSSLEVCTDPERAQKKINSFRCKSWNQYSDNMVAIDYMKKSQKLQKPIFLGCTILELSKNLMLNFHYNVIKKRYGNRAKKQFTDTDSLCYLIETENVYDDMLEDYQHYDFSPYEKDSPIVKKIEKLPKSVQKEIKANKKAFCKMKDENGNDPMIEYCGRAPKEYSYEESSKNLEKVKQQLNNLESETQNLDEMTEVDKLKYNQNKDELEQRIEKLENKPTTLKGKGVPGHVLKGQCSHAEAVEMIKNLGDESKHVKENFNKKVEFKGFSTKDHTIYTTNMIKTGMSVLDSKRFVSSDGITTLAWGHKDIPKL
jgi:exonuclease VII small subunit